MITSRSEKKTVSSALEQERGKTTTIIEGINHAPEKNIILCAFNKKIQVELNKRLTNPRAEAKTLHAIGFGCVIRNWKGVKVDDDRGMRIVKSLLTDDVPNEILRLIVRLASRSKSTCPFPTLEKMVSEAEDADLVPDDEFINMGYDTDFIAKHAMEAMNKACEKDGTIDFDDMVFVPLRNKWVFGRWDLVVVDEAQDMSYAQLLFAQRICKKNGRIIVVGDDRQAIYGFRGADHRSLELLKSSLKAKEFKLTITYRCPSKIVAEARQIVDDYEAAPNASEGEIHHITHEALIKDALPGDFVLSRKNAALAKVCLAFLRANKRAFIEGKDVGKTLITLVKKIKGKSVPDFISRLEKWKTRELIRAEKLGSEAKIEAKKQLIFDQHETLINLVDGLTSTNELVSRIEGLFADMAEGRHKSAICCSSVHKAKGLERDNVYLIEQTFNTRNIEERNIKYVAITRAKKKLVWVITKDENTDKKDDGIIEVRTPQQAQAFASEYVSNCIDVAFKHHGEYIP